jgi:hypothetical protein
LSKTESWPSGRRHFPAKEAYGLKSVSRVRIPRSPPMSLIPFIKGLFFCLSRTTRRVSAKYVQSQVAFQRHVFRFRLSKVSITSYSLCQHHYTKYFIYQLIFYILAPKSLTLAPRNDKTHVTQLKKILLSLFL